MQLGVVDDTPAGLQFRPTQGPAYIGQFHGSVTGQRHRETRDLLPTNRGLEVESLGLDGLDPFGCLQPRRNGLQNRLDLVEDVLDAAIRIGWRWSYGRRGDFGINDSLLDGGSEPSPGDANQTKLRLHLTCHDLGSFEVMGSIPPAHIQANSVDRQVNVDMRLVPMHDGHPLMRFQPHAANVRFGNLSNLVVAWIFAIRKRQSVMHDRFHWPRTKPSHHSKFTSQLHGCPTDHVAANNDSILPPHQEVVAEAAEA